MYKFALSLTATCLLVIAGPSSASAATVKTFTYTGAAQTFVVPAGVTSIHVVAVGGKGGTGAGNSAPGGFGGVVAADVAVTPGQLLYVNVGGNGLDATGAAGAGGGFNGGAAGGTSGDANIGKGGGGGGGETDIRISPGAFVDGLVIASGGGGSGGGTVGGGGGAGNINNTANGQDGGGGATGANPGGNGGAGATGTSGGSGKLGEGSPGQDSAANVGAGAGGGGGGGLVGGAGGGTGSGGGSNGGGGGAGSSERSNPAGQVTNQSFAQDTTGVPSVTFTYDLPSSPGGGGGNGGGGNGGGGNNSVPLVLSSMKLSPKAFVAAGHGGSTGGTVGTTISYTTSLAGTTTFTVLAPRRGVTAAKCVKPKRGRHGKRCTRYVSLGSFKHTDVAGSNSFVFTGRVRHHKLRDGRYRLRAVSSANGQTSAPVTANFRIAS
jgi:hypothetical protein